LNRFAGKVAVVTGGGGGMGVEFCAAFAKEGARVVMVDVSEQAVRKAAAGLKERGHDVIPVVLDVADEKAVSISFNRIAAEHGSIDVLVCGAAIRPLGNVLEQSLDVWHASMRVNVTGVFVSARSAARHMLKKGSGAIVTIGSVNGVRAVTGQAAYCASKAAVISLTQTLASELAPHGIRVNAILPAQVETPMIAEQVGEERKRREERIPMARYGKPSEIAAAACFLASEEASFITGHPLAVDGGYLAFGFRPAEVQPLVGLDQP
jgi:NAD(P)-dependent dehydrogenase (short-subunit alcohol dehydrogenase family)